VNKDGSVQFRDDVYERDAALARALLGARGGRLR
jgi:murein L,D-transpeptidase YcbB/YkuD